MNIPFLSVQSVSPSVVYLDLANPRFFGEPNAPLFEVSEDLSSPQNQELTRRHLIRHHGTTHLIDSISRLGFLQADSLVVREFKPGLYVVVEGNRRLAAIKTILNDLRRGVLVLPDQILSTFERLEVKVLEANPEDLEKSSLLLQGIRHISGAKSWGPYQQGHLIHTLVTCDGMTFTEAAKAVGLSISRVSALLRGYYGLRQLFENPEFGCVADTSLFSHFEHAHLKIPVRTWLGWDEDAKKYANESALLFFYSQILAQDGRTPKLISRDIRDLLPSVLEHQEARAAYLTGNLSIQEAYALLAPQAEHLSNLLHSANEFLKAAQKISSLQLASNDRKQLERLHQLTGQLLQASYQ